MNSEVKEEETGKRRNRISITLLGIILNSEWLKWVSKHCLFQMKEIVGVFGGEGR